MLQLYRNGSFANLQMCYLQVLKSTIGTSLPALFQLGSGPDSQSLAAILPAALPSEHDFCNDVHMATVHSASALFLHLLDGLKHRCSSPSVDDMKSLIQPASMILLTLCPVSCYDLLVAYLQSSAASGSHMLALTDAKCVEIHQFCSLLPDIVIEPIRAMAGHPNLAKLEELTKSVQPLHG